MLLNMIEPRTAAAYYDKCLLADIDVSHANWVMTANSLYGLPAPLRSRLDIVEITGPGPAHFDSVMQGLSRDLAGRWPVSLASLPPIPTAALRGDFAGHSSGRQLQCDLERIVAASVRLCPRHLH